jgi:hypothetical protein
MATVLEAAAALVASVLTQLVLVEMAKAVQALNILGEVLLAAAEPVLTMVKQLTLLTLVVLVAVDMDEAKALLEITLLIMVLAAAEVATQAGLAEMVLMD